MKTKMRKGFTLVEILIVVVILGILAAIVIPQFSQASTDSKISSCQSNLQSMRSQIALFKIQHSDDLPPAVTTDSTAWDEMLMYTNAAADTFGTARDTATGLIYGPYLQSVPVNPFTGRNTVSTTATNNATTGGWYYDATNGTIVADDGGTTDGVAHSSY